MAAAAAVMTRLTFGDDRTPASDTAWEWVTAQRWPDWRVDVVRAVSVTARRSSLAPARRAPARCGFASVRTIDSPLEPRAALIAHAGTDLLVVGAQAWSSSGQPVGLGSTVDAVVRRAGCPVVVARDSRPVHSVVACVDDSAASWTVARVLLTSPLLERATVTVLTVAGVEGVTASQPREVVDALAAAGVRAHLRVVDPDDIIATSGPGFRIAEVVERVRPDLVAVGAPGSGLTARIAGLRGSVAMQVARTVSCSVLLAR